MSTESAQSLFDRLDQDEAFASELAERREDPDAVQAMIRDAGFDVTPEEMHAVFLERYGADLSEEQLEAIAGGVTGAEIAAGVILGGVAIAGIAVSAAAAAI